jgi:hypothetical protein
MAANALIEGPDAIVVRPDAIRAFGSEAAQNFVLVTNRKYASKFVIPENNIYGKCKVVCFDEGDDFEKVLRDQIPADSHILTILPDCLLESVDPQLLERRKLLIMACRSGRTDLAGVQHFLTIGSSSDLERDEALAVKFFAGAESSAFLTLVDRDATCSFHHMSSKYEWHEQFGNVQWGQQQVFPSGEIACFVVPLDAENLAEDVSFDLNGEMILRGPAIVQSGPPSFLIDDQLRIYAALSTISNDGLRLRIRDGEIVDHRPEGNGCLLASEMLSALFHVDSRYRRIYEVGFSINQSLTLWPGNTAMNEVWGERGGKIHLGLGMLPHTQYHLDLFCAGARVLSDKGQLIFGAEPMRRVKSGACPCTMV